MCVCVCVWVQFPSIGLAIEAASPGDNIVVFEGHYREAITLTKPLEVRRFRPDLPYTGILGRNPQYAHPKCREISVMHALKCIRVRFVRERNV